MLFKGSEQHVHHLLFVQAGALLRVLTLALVHQLNSRSHTQCRGHEKSVYIERRGGERRGGWRGGINKGQNGKWYHLTGAITSTTASILVKLNESTIGKRIEREGEEGGGG